MRRPGTVQVHKTCEEYLPHLDRKSKLERAFDRWLAKHPEIPPPQRNIKLAFWEIDCYWPEHRLALELDGRPYHTVVEDIERDRRKDAWLQVHGNLILRVTDSRFRRDKPGVYRDLTTMLALAEVEPPGRLINAQSAAPRPPDQRTAASAAIPQAVERDVEDVVALPGGGLLDLRDSADQLDDLGEVGVGAHHLGLLGAPQHRLAGDEQVGAAVLKKAASRST